MNTLRLEEKTVDWLENERNISAEIAARCGVVTMNGWPAFEYRRNGLLQYVKARKQDQNDRLEQEAILDTYLHALGMAPEPEDTI